MFIDYKTPPFLETTKVGGRPKIDFEALHAEWIKSDMALDLFLTQYKIDMTRVYIARMVEGWEKDKPYTPPPAVTKTRSTPKAKKSNVHRISSVSRMINPSITDEDDVNKQISQIWQTITKWRAEQFHNDYSIADKLRIAVDDAIERLLSAGRADPNPAKIRSSEILSLAKAIEVIQKIQRLSLGMSTENLGVQSPREMAEEAAFAAKAAQAEQNKQEDDNVPTFEVGVTEQGKFKRLKPRQVG